jgi:hypothetical protein
LGAVDLVADLWKAELGQRSRERAAKEKPETESEEKPAALSAAATRKTKVARQSRQNR